MIQNKDKNLEIESIGEDIPSLTANIDKEDLSFLFSILANQYKNPIGSLIREITSNCFDSHLEAKVEDAVVIDFDEDEEGTYIYFKDVGTGLSPDKIRNIYMNYGKSTKRNDSQAIGYYGLGSKSPLAYTDHFYIITISDKIKYTYMFHEGETLPTLEKLNEEETADRNGTTIKVYLKEGYNEKNKFINALKSELAYFDNVYFGNSCDIQNDYKIFEGNNFKWRSSDVVDPNMHICLGKVTYPIDWKEIGASKEVDEYLFPGYRVADPIRLPVAIKFNIGELSVVPSRESIKYTDEAIIKIRKKIKDAIIEIRGLFKKQSKLAEDVFEIIKNENRATMLSFPNPDGLPYGLNVSAIISKKDLILKHKDFVNLPITIDIELIFTHLKIDKVLRDSGLRDIRYTANWAIKNRISDCIYADKEYEKVKNLFIKCNDDKYFIKESHLTYQQWKKQLRIPNGSIGVAKAILIYRRTVLNDIFNHGVKKYTDIHITPEWLDEYKLSKKKKKTIVEGSIEVRHLINEGNNSHPEYKFKVKSMKLQQLEDYTGFIIYGIRASRKKLEAIYSLITQRLESTIFRDDKKRDKRIHPFHILCISADKIKYFKKPNMAYIETVTPHARVFRDIVTAYRISKMNIQYSNDYSEYLRKFNYNIATKMALVIKFKEDNWRRSVHDSAKELVEEMYEMAVAENLWNHTIIDAVKEIEEFLAKVPLMAAIQVSKVPDEAVADYFKKSKVKLNESWYKSSLDTITPQGDIHEYELNQEQLSEVIIASSANNDEDDTEEIIPLNNNNN